MTTAIVCALLAGVAWLVTIGGPENDAAMVFAIVWTAMAAAYVGRELRRRAGAIRS